MARSSIMVLGACALIAGCSSTSAATRDTVRAADGTAPPATAEAPAADPPQVRAAGVEIPAPPSTTAVANAELHPGVYGGEGDEFDAWPAYVEFRDDSTGRLLMLTGSAAVPTEVTFGYEADGEQVTLSREAFPGCSSTEPAVYDWSLDRSFLVLTSVSEPCPTAMEPFPPRWRRLDHPLVENALTDQPLVVETALGTIEWTAVESNGAFVENVLEVSDRYVGVSWWPDIDGPQIVKSSDGSEWTPIPPPPDFPFGFSLLAGRDDVLYAFVSGHDPVGYPFPDPVYSTDDWGTTWLEVPMTVEPSEANAGLIVTGVASGEGGVVLATACQAHPLFGPCAGTDGEFSAGPLWVLGQTRLERIEAPFTGQPGQVHVDAVDDGFFAYVQLSDLDSLVGEAEGASWFSTDGRTWTGVTGRPASLTVSAADGRTIYGVSDPPGADNDRAVVSTDGGRTWTTSPDRPRGWMEAGDRGLVIRASWTDSGQCAKVLWVSGDDREWERALDLWPGGSCIEMSMTGNTIRVGAYNDGDNDPITWLGTVT